MKKSGDAARPDELGADPAQVGPRSAGQSGALRDGCTSRMSLEESTEELADTKLSWESAAVEGSEDAADHPQRPAHTHVEYSRPDDLPPKRGSR